MTGQREKPKPQKYINAKDKVDFLANFLLSAQQTVTTEWLPATSNVFYLVPNV